MEQVGDILARELRKLAVNTEDEKEKKILFLQARVLELEIENEQLRRMGNVKDRLLKRKDE